MLTLRSHYRSLPAAPPEPEPAPVELAHVSVLEAVLDPATVFVPIPRAIVEPEIPPNEIANLRKSEAPTEPQSHQDAGTISGSTGASPLLEHHDSEVIATPAETALTVPAPLRLPKESWLRRWQRRWWHWSRATSATFQHGQQWFCDGLARLRHLPLLTPAERAEQRYRRALQLQLQVDAHVPSDSVAFFGDQSLEWLTATAVTPLGVNYGIADETIARLQWRIRRYRILSRYRAVVLSTGHNDLTNKTDAEILHDYERLLDSLPVPVIVCGLLPVDEQVDEFLAGRNSRITALNRGLLGLCNAAADRRFVDIRLLLLDQRGHLMPEYHRGDGVQLSAAGSDVWIQALQQCLQ